MYWNIRLTKKPSRKTQLIAIQQLLVGDDEVGGQWAVRQTVAQQVAMHVRRLPPTQRCYWWIFLRQRHLKVTWNARHCSTQLDAPQQNIWLSSVTLRDITEQQFDLPGIYNVTCQFCNNDGNLRFKLGYLHK